MVVQVRFAHHQRYRDSPLKVSYFVYQDCRSQSTWSQNAAFAGSHEKQRRRALAEKSAKKHAKKALEEHPVDADLLRALESVWSELDAQHAPIRANELVLEELFLGTDETLKWVAQDDKYYFRYRSANTSVWTFWLTWNQLHEVVVGNAVEIAMTPERSLETSVLP